MSSFGTNDLRRVFTNNGRLTCHFAGVSVSGAVPVRGAIPVKRHIAVILVCEGTEANEIRGISFTKRHLAGVSVFEENETKGIILFLKITEPSA